MKSEQHIKNKHEIFFDNVSSALFNADPISINFSCNPEEYDTEAIAIIPCLKSAKSTEDTLTIVYEKFRYYFGEDIAGEKEKYAIVSEKIWQLWCEYNCLYTRHQNPLL